MTRQKKLPNCFIYSILVLVLVLNGCAGQAPIPTIMPTETSTPVPLPLRELIPMECRTPNISSLKAECYDLLVPEDRSNVDNGMIRLHVAIFKSKSSNPAPDPILFLSGGPGEPGIPVVMYLNSFSGFVGGNRDVIVFDQRGTGESQPSLACPEVDQFFFDTLNQSLSQSDYNKIQNEAWLICRDRLITEGIQLNAYNSASSAADADDLRRALGVEKWNLFGGSYGTRLGLAIMRDFPQGVRSAVLDSVYPLPETLAGYKDDFRGKGSLQYLLTRCAANAECGSAYPDLENTLAELIVSLNENPISLTSQMHSGVGWSNGPEVTISGDRLITILFFMMYSVSDIPYLPKLIVDTKNGNFELLSKYAGKVIPPLRNTGMSRSVSCVDNVSSQIVESEPASPSKLDEMLFTFGQQQMNESFRQICQKWVSVSTGSEGSVKFASDIPALLLAGEFDPATPVGFAELAKETLSHSYLYEFPGFGHSLISSDSASNGCVGKLMIAFWNDPTVSPDDSCVAKIKPRKFITK